MEAWDDRSCILCARPLLSASCRLLRPSGCTLRLSYSASGCRLVAPTQTLDAPTAPCSTWRDRGRATLCRGRRHALSPKAEAGLHFESATAWLQHPARHRLLRPALLECRPSSLAGGQDPGGREAEAQEYRRPRLRLASCRVEGRFLVDRANAGEFGVRFHEYDSAQTSTMYAATHARGGSNSLLWISEWGCIQATDLRRSEEILTGAIPSAKNGTIVVATWRGGRGGHLWEIIKKHPLERRPDALPG